MNEFRPHLNDQASHVEQARTQWRRYNPRQSSGSTPTGKIGLAYAVPAFVFSGYTWPQYAMDTMSTIISYTFPITYFADTVRALMIAGHAPSLGKNILALLVIGMILLVISSLVYKNKRAKLSASHKDEVIMQA